MKNQITRCATMALLVALTAGLVQAAPRRVPAFPGAEGAGMYTTGGRGGRVIAVTSLADSGPGTFREAVSAEGPRIVIFRVGGVIRLLSPIVIDKPDITIVGHTAPGDGVVIVGETVNINTSNVIVRYMRFRRGDQERGDDCLGGQAVSDIIIDHCSASWGLDENISIYRYHEMVDGVRVRRLTRNVTIQWTISSEALDKNNHAFGATWGGDPSSFHHNLFACNTARNPSIGETGTQYWDFRNNVVFNWQYRTIDGGDGASKINIVANYFKPGPATQAELRDMPARLTYRGPHYANPGIGKYFIADNYMEGYPETTADNWKGVRVNSQGRDVVPPPDEEVKAMARVDAAFPAAPITARPAVETYRLVLEGAGATLPVRDAVDSRIIEIVRTGTPTFGTGIIKHESEVGGLPQYRSGQPCLDSDGDGMPDWWEKKYGLNPHDASDGKGDVNGSGYTNLEEYLNGTDPTKFVDYAVPGNNVNTLNRGAIKPSPEASVAR